MFLAAPFEAALGPSILATRLPMAVAGAATVAIGFFAMRVLFDRPAAYAWAVLAACSSWLIFFNRTGFTVPTFPLTEVASLLAVGFALKKRWWPWYVLAGAVVGAGIYGYYAYPLFAIGLGAWVLVHMAIERPQPLLLHARNIAVMGLTALLVIQPMWPYFFDSEIGYSHDRTVFAVSGTEEYEAAETRRERIDLYLDNAETLARTLLWEGQLDYSDGTGSKPALDWIVISLAGAGFVLGLALTFKERKAAYLLTWMIIPLILIGPIWSIDGYHRRSLGILVLVLMAAAVAVSYAVRSAQRRGPTPAAVAVVMMAGLLLVYGIYNVDKYWGQKDTPAMLYTYVPELTAASLWAQDQPDDLPLYFFSDRWSINYETSHYLLDGRLNMTDRSAAFGTPGETGLPNIEAAVGGIILLTGGYILSEEGNASLMYPDATRWEGPSISGRPAFVAFVVDASG
jgi:hypothetical protein